MQSLHAELHAAARGALIGVTGISSRKPALVLVLCADLREQMGYGCSPGPRPPAPPLRPGSRDDDRISIIHDDVCVNACALIEVKAAGRIQISSSGFVYLLYFYDIDPHRHQQHYPDQVLVID